MCKSWPSYKGHNDWRICKLVPKTTEDERDAGESMKGVLIAMEARIALMIREGKIGAVATMDEAAINGSASRIHFKKTWRECLA